MPDQRGSLDRSGSPVITIKIAGIFKGGVQEFNAVLDTGFTGFISMPLFKAFPLGLVLFSTTSVVFADTSTQVRLLALGQAIIGEEPPQPGLIILEWGDGEVLVGMDFLRNMKKSLTISPAKGTVLLADDDRPPALATPHDTEAESVATENDSKAAGD